MKIFQIIVLAVFAFSLILAVLIFSGILPFFNTAPAGVGGNVLVWGTIPEEFLREPIRTLNEENDRIFTVNYVEKGEDTFDQELIEALASSRGPDLIFLPQDLLVRHADKVIPIPYENMSVREFRDMFIEEGELYLSGEGIIALPTTVDPLVMYWNRDIFTSASIPAPPQFWDEFLTLAPKLTVKDDAFNIERSTIAFGEFKNVEHAKDIISLLVLQTDNPIVTVGENGLEVVFAQRLGAIIAPAESAVRFFTEFSNPVKLTYSWNRTLPNSRDAFAAGDLAVYIGYASERARLRSQSPNLNFDIALVPQSRDTSKKTTFGALTGIAVLRSSPNLQTAFHAAFEISGKDFSKSFVDSSFLPPVHRDLLADVPTGLFGEILYTSALIAKGWLDPRPDQTDEIFRAMIENVTSGRATINEAVSRADGEIRNLISGQ